MMASGQGYLELKVLGSLPIDENNFNFLNEKSYSCLFAIKLSHIKGHPCFFINTC
jgi:hypothetical protein